MKVLAAIISLSTMAGVGMAAAKTDSTAYLVEDLVSDRPEFAAVVDPHLVNGWGLAVFPGGGAF